MNPFFPKVGILNIRNYSKFYMVFFHSLEVVLHKDFINIRRFMESQDVMGFSHRLRPCAPIKPNVFIKS